MTTNEKLKNLMASRKLQRKDVATKTRSTIFAVDGWLREAEDPSFRTMPVAKLELLIMKIKEELA